MQQLIRGLLLIAASSWLIHLNAFTNCFVQKLITELHIGMPVPCKNLLKCQLTPIVSSHIRTHNCQWQLVIIVGYFEMNKDSLISAKLFAITSWWDFII